MKRKHIIELVIVVIVLAGLFVLMVPHFLNSQQFGLQRLIHNDLDSICKAVKAYSMKYGQFPTHLNTNSNPFYAQKSNGTFVVNVDTISFDNYQAFITPFVKDGFLHPSIQLDSRFQDFPLHPRHFSLFSIAKALDNNAFGPAKPVNWGIAINWPHAAPKRSSISIGTSPSFGSHLPNGSFFLATKPFNPFDRLIKPSIGFAPSNGLESSGMLYADIQGNSIP